MLSAKYLGNREIGIQEAQPEPPLPGQAQIEVAYVGICGTDMHVLHGEMDDRVGRPAILGHEMSGVIAALGDGVTGWQVGDHVTAIPLDWDGTCPACLAGNHSICHHLSVKGVDSPGALQSLWNVDADHLVALPHDLRLDHAALVEPLAVAIHDVRRADLAAGDHAVVLGGGPIGALIAMVAQHAGAQVVVAEISSQRRESLATLGLDTLDPTATDQAAWVDDWTAGAGADIVFEVSGAAAAVLAATELVKARGTLVIVAIHTHPRPMDLHRVFVREIRILGARVYERTDFERAIELLTSGVIPVDGLITRIEPITATAQAFAELETGLAMKVLINVSSPATAT